MTKEYAPGRWASAWPDALAFALGLGVARLAGWTTTDLVWSLWLSSLVVGYAIISWTIIRPGTDIARGAWRDRTLVAQAMQESSRGAAFAGVGILLAVGLFMLAFFTVHFGGFHYVHSQFLIGFFPIDGAAAGHPGTAGTSTYVEVARRYWLFLPSAFLAERAAFAREPGKGASAAMLAPYQNVMRMHGLIFFFAFAHFTGLDTFAVYAVVYAVYFFPWRLVKEQRDRRDQGDRGDQGAQTATG